MNASHDAWPRGWEQHEQQQLERQARLSFDEKLEWLEDAHKLVLEFQGQETLNISSAHKDRKDQ